jgi:hypothetical protein
MIPGLKPLKRLQGLPPAPSEVEPTGATTEPNSPGAPIEKLRFIAPVNWTKVARRLWPDAEWISGDGPFAFVEPCRVTTVHLCDTYERAYRIKTTQGYLCGGMCNPGRHFILDLNEYINWRRPRKPRRK